jgi:hypothetical protein
MTRIGVDAIEHTRLSAFELLVPLPVLVRKLHAKLKVATPNAPVSVDLAAACEH